METGRPARKWTSEILDEFFSIKYVTAEAETTKFMKLAVVLDDAIKARKMKKHEFASVMKVQPSVITKWLSGEQNFTIDTLFKIEAALKIKIINI